MRVLESFSPKACNDDRAVVDWIGMFNRLPAYRGIAAPALVIGFDDVVIPPHLAKEVADALPNGRYLQIPDADHIPS
jgi:pimeloyl-ACP methyl ester carboxylesterase